MSIVSKIIPKSVRIKIKKYCAPENKILIDSALEEMAERKIDKQNYGVCYKRFKGKVVVITGATGSIGQKLAVDFAKEGAMVIVCGRNPESVNKIAEEIREAGFLADKAVFNLLDEKEIEKAFADIAAKHKKIDVLLNCAGGSARSKVQHLYQQDIAVIDEILSLNLRAPMLCAKFAAPYMIEQNSGSIINFESLMGTNGKAGYVDYGAAKAGIGGLTRGLAIELGKYNINVNSVTPSYVPIGAVTESRFNEFLKSNFMNSTGCSDDITACALFLSSEQARFITGQNIIVDGGRSLGLKGD